MTDLLSLQVLLFMHKTNLLRGLEILHFRGDVLDSSTCLLKSQEQPTAPSQTMGGKINQLFVIATFLKDHIYVTYEKS